MMNTIVSTPNFQVTNETTTVVKNIVLEGVNVLKAEKITTTVEVKRELDPKTNKPLKIISKKKVEEVVEPISFNLVELKPEELAEYRKSGISSFVLKVDGKLYYASIPDNINFIYSTILGAHRCAIVGHECNRLSAASDEEGGCAKVRDHSPCIERYSWITTGYETFNTKHDSFVVVKCLHYEKCPPRKKISVIEANNARLCLAQSIWDDVRTIEEVRARKKKNEDNIGIF